MTLSPSVNESNLRLRRCFIGVVFWELGARLTVLGVEVDPAKPPLSSLLQSASSLPVSATEMGLRMGWVFQVSSLAEKRAPVSTALEPK